MLIKRGLVSFRIPPARSSSSRQGYVQGSPVALAYYNNIMSTIALVPVVVLTGEAPGVLRLLIGGARTFFWGALITVSGVVVFVEAEWSSFSLHGAMASDLTVLQYLVSLSAGIDVQP